MAYITTADMPRASATKRAGFGGWFVRWMNRLSRHDQIRALNALSDTQLASRGLTRAGIPAHVFRDRMYL